MCEIDSVKYRTAEHRAEYIGQQVYYGGALAVGVCAERGQQHRDGRADRNAHDQWESGREVDRAGDGERLQNTDGRGSALQDGGEQQPREDAEQRVREDRQHMDESLAFGQRGNRAAHSAHAEHQHGETKHDIAGVDMALLFAEHAQERARD